MNIDSWLSIPNSNKWDWLCNIFSFIFQYQFDQKKKKVLERL